MMNTASNVIKFILSTLLLFGLGVIVLNMISYNRRLTDRLKTYKRLDTFRTVSSGIIADFESNTKPEKLTVKKNHTAISIRKYNVSLKDEKFKDVFIRESGTGDYHILLLHGAQSSSKIWEDIGTLYYLSNWGYHSFAVDIPPDQETVQWLRKLIGALQLTNLVLISPSMSGRLTLPYIIQLKKHEKLIRGFVPIAPAGTNQFQTNEYKQIKIPTLIIHGQNDTRFQSAFEKLQQIPTSKILLIKNASHGSYVEKPIEFHNGLRQFLYNIYRPIYRNTLVFNTQRNIISNEQKKTR